MLARLPTALLLTLITAPALAQPATYTAHDTLKATADAHDPAASPIRELTWTPDAFTVTVENRPATEPSLLSSDADAIVTFPSPRPAPDGGCMNTVVLEWYRARSPSGGPLLKAPALLSLHILDNRFIVERGIARAMAAKGVHVFIMHDPGWGMRRDAAPGSLINGAVFFERATQAVADARRSRDAIAALPSVDPSRIGLEGASLGGFIGAATASLDHAFTDVFIFLAGGNLYDMFIHGQNEAQRIRRALAAAGYTDEKLRQLCERIEPTRLAHRLDPQRTWLFSATTDQVVPTANANALAAAARLTADHHQWIPGDHYTAALNLPWLVNFMATTIQKN